MSAIQIILIIIIIPITILNIRFITSGRRVKDAARSKYASVLRLLRQHEAELGGSGAYTAAKYVSDSGNNFLVCRCLSRDLGALICEDSFHMLSPLSASKCELEVCRDGNKGLKRISCIVYAPSLELPVAVSIAENAHRNKHMINVLLEIAQDFCDEINRPSL